MPAQCDRPTIAVPLSQGKDAARLIVCERRGLWAAALRRELPPPAVRIYETRSVPECWDLLARSPASFVVAELTRAGAGPLLESMSRLERDFPWARVAVVADRTLASCQWWIREAGAVHFCVSLRQAGELAQLALRHLQAAPQPQRTLAEQVWASLPWGPPGA